MWFFLVGIFQPPTSNSTTESVKIANTLIAWPQKTGCLPDGAPLLPPGVILLGIAKNTICCPFQEGDLPPPLELQRTRFSVGIWQHDSFHHITMLFRKVTVPPMVTLPAIINIPEKGGLSLHFYLCQRGWKQSCCYFICAQDWKSFGEGAVYKLDGKFFRGPSWPFFFCFCFQLASFLLALVDIYRNFPSSNYPWRTGNPKAAFSHQNLFSLLNSWRVRCDQAYQMCHSGGMVKKDLQTFRGYSLWVHWRSQRIQQPMSRATEPSMWQRVFCGQNPWWHSEQSGLLGCIHVCHHFMRLNLQLSWGFCELPPSSPHPQRSCQ